MREISIIGSGSWAQALTKVFVQREILVKYRKLVNKSKPFRVIENNIHC